ncbi:Gfo/Idh/MocA family oxidoreductase [Labedella phragmitis]|uniref:Gfo/Idh/MocA family oxidoreductase n=1 Tax=Labedella phragmitis TaxID=2498849 RepID=A0A3S4DD67_9MICO|nr:Gfo/Idh/MocA family oxidoreductase [Labedella phragmitis]RWZ46306.1 Gfo/Idh/MocA family oxidoreductase [Labedella phragmitis]
MSIDPATGRRVRLGIIGLGLITQSVHLPNLRRLADRFEIVRVCDLSASVAEGIAAELGAIAHGTRSQEVIDDPAVEAVLLCTPGAHSELARRALEAGKHVFAEKPYAYDPETAQRDAAFAASVGLVLQVGYMKMYEPAMAEARRRLPEIGAVRLVRMTVLHPSDEHQTVGIPVLRGSDVSDDAIAAAVTANRREVADALSADPGVDPVLFRNVLHGSVCHQAAVLRALLPDDEATVSWADADATSEGERPGPPRLQVGGRLSGGAQWTLSWNWLPDYPGYSEWVEILGDAGVIRIDLPGPYGDLPSATLRVTSAAEPPVDSGVWDPGTPAAFVRELTAFSDAIREGAAVRSTADGAAADARLLLEIARRLA